MSQSPAIGHRGAKTIPLRRKLVYACVPLLGLFLVLAVVELALRGYVHFRYGRPGKSYGIYTSDPVLGATHRPHSYNSNSVLNNLGLRNLDDVEEKKPDGALRIYCSGGSTTYCYNLPTEQAWPTLLQQQLRRHQGHERDEVLNAGQICFAVNQEVVLAERLVPRLHPDVVILFTGVNEYLAGRMLVEKHGLDLDALQAEGRWGLFPTRLDQAQFLQRHSVLAKLFDYRVKVWLERAYIAAFVDPDENPPPPHPWMFENFDRGLRRYLEFLDEHGCAVIMVRYGDNGDDGEQNWHLENCLRVFRERGIAIGREYGVSVCDFEEQVAGLADRRELFTYSGVHVTHAGAELLAHRLATLIVENFKPNAEEAPCAALPAY